MGRKIHLQVSCIYGNNGIPFPWPTDSYHQFFLHSYYVGRQYGKGAVLIQMRGCLRLFELYQVTISDTYFLKYTEIFQYEQMSQGDNRGVSINILDRGYR